jgi:poly-gamma-glutamate synthesis protein (capsule biosynthesis protein)
MVKAGADLVIGHHPHVVQPVEAYRGRWIAYSLGNFVFDQKSPEGVHHGLMLKVTLRDKRIAAVSSIPISIDRSFQAVVTGREEPRRPARHAGGKSAARPVR